MISPVEVISLAGVASAQSVAHPTNLRYILAAFLAVWVGYFLYAMLMSWRERRLRRDVEELRGQVAEKGKKNG